LLLAGGELVVTRVDVIGVVGIDLRARIVECGEPRRECVA
jgi:hypothetical protein